MKRIMLFMTLAAAALLASCNKDGVITGAGEPKITLDNPEGVYAVKVGRSVTIAPTVENAEGAVYSWLLDGRLVGSEPAYTYSAEEAGSYYLLFRVETDGGKAEEELRIDVSELLPPAISFPAADDGVLTVAVGRDTEIVPQVANGEGAVYEWTLDGETVGDGPAYTFNTDVAGDYVLALRVENEDGAAEESVVVRAVERIEAEAFFPAPYYAPGESAEKSVSLGRTIYLRPEIAHFGNSVFEWSVDGVSVRGEGGQVFAFAPEAEGRYSVRVKVTDDDGAEAVAETVVECFGPEASHRRAAGAGSSPLWSEVFEYIAAPGQFINDPKAGMEGVKTPAEAADYAARRMREEAYVSLGAWGGYIVVGFDHSIDNAGAFGGYDFSVTGNQFEGSSEPGIVWVMQDTNGNGLPDDEWYELKGSEYGKAETVQNYAITYYRPSGPGMDVQYTDNRGDSGVVDYNVFHTQAYYYPEWIEEDSYTLYGTKLAANTTVAPSGQYSNDAYEWGYADNAGSDKASGDNPNASAQKVYFKISNAVNLDGTPAELQYIDFVKVQTGISHVAGHLGEISTEVFSFEDENMAGER